MSEVDQFADQIFRAVKAYLDEKIDVSDAKLRQFEIEGFAKLHERIDALEKAPFEYTGVHQAGRTYRRGQFSTYGGSVWHCQRESTTQRPGDGSDWVLAVKAGRDAR